MPEPGQVVAGRSLGPFDRSSGSFSRSRLAMNSGRSWGGSPSGAASRPAEDGHLADLGQLVHQLGARP